MNEKQYPGRPDFIPADLFRRHLRVSQLQALFYVDNIQAGSWVRRCEREGWPLKSRRYRGLQWYRPIDIVARARAHHLAIKPQLRVTSYEAERDVWDQRRALEREIAALRDEFCARLAATKTYTAELSLQSLSSKLTGTFLFGHDQIVNASVAFSEQYATGIYFLIKNGTVVYVGQSVNMFQRVVEHRPLKDFDRFTVLPVPRESLDAVESLYIHLLRPALNGRSANGKLCTNARLDQLQVVALSDDEMCDLT